MSAPRLTRWHAAGWFWLHAPQIRGRDRAFNIIRGRGIPRALRAHPYTVVFGPDLHCTVPIADDGSFVALFFAQYVPPALAPILEATLRDGDCFYDVGANVGVYSLWASTLVGPTGEVQAFEPAPRTRAWLVGLLRENGAENVSVQPVALSDREASVQLEVIAHASGVSRIGPGPTGAGLDAERSDERQVEVVEIRTRQGDEFVAAHRPPKLIKIDVEGHERAVLAGLRDTLRVHRPVVVFEAPDAVGTAGDTEAIVADMRALGLVTWSLTPKGLEPYRHDSYSHNLLVLDPEAHEDVREALATIRFPRQQNC